MKFPKNLFIGGKGGVGKSTISSAFALLSARSGSKTLLISTDPAHNLNDIFKFKQSSECVLVEDNFYILEINPKKEVNEYVENVATLTKQFISASSYDMLDSYYNNVKKSGVAQESALFDKLINIIAKSTWDRIIVDTAPTGHTLRLFSLPKILKEWSKALLSKQDKSRHLESIIGHIEGKNPLQDRLEERHLIYTKFFNMLHDENQSGIIFVLNPEQLSIAETTRAIDELKMQSLKPIALIVNKIPPSSDDDFFMQRYNISKHYMQIIQKELKDYPLCNIPLQSQDILGLESLDSIALHLKDLF